MLGRPAGSVGTRDCQPGQRLLESLYIGNDGTEMCTCHERKLVGIRR